MQAATQNSRISSIDVLRGLVMVIMALDHVRMYFGYGTWYAEPTNLATTTPPLFFTRWITHFCAPVFVFLAGTSAYLRAGRNAETGETARYLFTRGIWLIVVEVLIVSFAWTFDITYGFIILQVIWAIGISMVALSALIFLPSWSILAIGLALVFGHNLLDAIDVSGTAGWDFIWSALHESHTFFAGSTTVSVVYPVLPWIGLMVLGYVAGILYRKDFSPKTRKRLLLSIGAAAVLVFLVLRAFNFYGEPRPWSEQDSFIFTAMSFLNTTKYPPSLQFLLMTMGPALILLSVIKAAKHRVTSPLLVFGRVPFFFYIIHLYLIHGLATLWLVFSGRMASEYILSARRIASGALSSFGLSLPGVYLVWMLVIILLYPLCRWYQKYRENHPSKWWLSYL